MGIAESFVSGVSVGQSFFTLKDQKDAIEIKKKVGMAQAEADRIKALADAMGTLGNDPKSRMLRGAYMSEIYKSVTAPEMEFLSPAEQKAVINTISGMRSEGLQGKTSETEAKGGMISDTYNEQVQAAGGNATKAQQTMGQQGGLPAAMAGGEPFVNQQKVYSTENRRQQAQGILSKYLINPEEVTPEEDAFIRLNAQDLGMKDVPPEFQTPDERREWAVGLSKTKAEAGKAVAETGKAVADTGKITADTAKISSDITNSKLAPLYSMLTAQVNAGTMEAKDALPILQAAAEAAGVDPSIVPDEAAMLRAASTASKGKGVEELGGEGETKYPKITTKKEAVRPFMPDKTPTPDKERIQKVEDTRLKLTEIIDSAINKSASQRGITISPEVRQRIRERKLRQFEITNEKGQVVGYRQNFSDETLEEYDAKMGLGPASERQKKSRKSDATGRALQGQ